MNDNVIIATVQLKTEPLHYKVENPVLSILDKPSRNLVEDWVRDWGSKGHPYYLLITDDTPRDLLHEMTDYSFLKEDYDKYRNVLQPIWNDDWRELDKMTLRIVEKLNKCCGDDSISHWEMVKLAL